MEIPEFTRKMKSGIPALGLCIMYPAVGIIERIGGDWDWIWIDWQHGQHDYQSVLACVRASNSVQRPAIVRVYSHDYGVIGQALDTGADGIMVPMVNTAKEAQAVVKGAKFPPLGSRSYGSRRLIDTRGREYSHNANTHTLLIAQIETKEGLENTEEIAATEGIDGLFFGPDDISMQDGLPMDKPRETTQLEGYMRTVAGCAERYGKFAGITVPSMALYESALNMGYSFFVASGDVTLIASGSKAARRNYEEFEMKRGKEKSN